MREPKARKMTRWQLGGGSGCLTAQQKGQNILRAYHTPDDQWVAAIFKVDFAVALTSWVGRGVQGCIQQNLNVERGVPEGVCAVSKSTKTEVEHDVWSFEQKRV